MAAFACRSETLLGKWPERDHASVAAADVLNRFSQTSASRPADIADRKCRHDMARWAILERSPTQKTTARHAGLFGGLPGALGCLGRLRQWAFRPSDRIGLEWVDFIA